MKLTENILKQMIKEELTAQENEDKVSTATDTAMAVEKYFMGLDGNELTAKTLIRKALEIAEGYGLKHPEDKEYIQLAINSATRKLTEKNFTIVNL